MSDDSFFNEIQHLNLVRAFARTIPSWARQHNSTIGFHLKNEDGGVSIQMSLPEKDQHRAEQLSVDFIEKLKIVERLIILESLIEELKRIGADENHINNFVAEGEKLIRILEPEIGD